MERLGAAADGGEALEGDADDVVERLLGGEGDAAGLGVEAELHRLRILGSEALAHDLGPHAAGGAELRDLLEHVVVAVEEEREAGREGVDLEAGVDGGLGVGDAGAEGEGDFLDGGAALLTEVVAGDRDRVPLRDVLLAVREEVGREPHGVLGRVDVVPAGDVLLEDVVLDRAAELGGVDALLLTNELVEKRSTVAGALIVIDVDTESSGI